MYNAYKEEKHALPTNEKAKRNRSRLELFIFFWRKKKSIRTVYEKSFFMIINYIIMFFYIRETWRCVGLQKAHGTRTSI